MQVLEMIECTRHVFNKYVGIHLYEAIGIVLRNIIIDVKDYGMFGQEKKHFDMMNIRIFEEVTIAFVIWIICLRMNASYNLLIYFNY